MKVGIIKSIIAVLVFAFALNIQAESQLPAQSHQLNGEWTGISKYLGQNYPVNIQIQQNSLSLTGELNIENLNKTKFSTYTINGVIEGDIITLKGLKFVQKQGSWCLPTIYLTYSQQDEYLVLEGKWKYLVNGLNKNDGPLYSAEQLFYDLKIAVINNSPNGPVPQYGVIR